MPTDPDDDPESQAERRRVLRNDARAREQANTFMSHTHDDLDLGGRFAKQISQTVVGATPVPNYPQGPAWSADPTGIEPPLGYDINEMPPLEPAPVTSSPSDDAAQEPDGPVVADPSAAHSDVDRATGPSSFSRRR